MRTKECSTAPNKKKVAVIPGKGVTAEDFDFEEWRQTVLNTANSSSDDNDGFDTVFFDGVHDMFPDDDDRSVSSRIANIPHHENEENIDPLNVDQADNSDKQFKVPELPGDDEPASSCSKYIDTKIANDSTISPSSFVVSN
ncbi:hypothetical protein ACJJTC_004838 [Scirpophaga incertulas]